MRTTLATISVAVLALSACSTPARGGGGGGGSTGSGTTGGGTGGTGGTGGGTGGDLSAFKAEYTDAACTAVDACFGELAANFGLTDCPDALGTLFDNITGPLMQQAIDKGTVVYDSAAFAACADALKDGCGFLGTGLPDACSTVFEGQVAAGAACAQSLECAPNHWCESGAECEGTCKAKVGAGQPCTEEEACEAGLLCEADVCIAAPTEGDACDTEGVSCALGTACVAAAGGTTGTCRAYADFFTVPMGGACNLADGALCKDGVCVLQPDFTGKCEAMSTPGGACKGAFPSQCPAWHWCAADTSTCQPLPAEGEACLPQTELVRCNSGLACVAEACAALTDLGAPCEVEETCHSGNCDDGVCTAPKLSNCASSSETVDEGMGTTDGSDVPQ